MLKYFGYCKLALLHRQSFELQGVSTSMSLAPDCQLKCHASADSILDYGQYVILSTGNLMLCTNREFDYGLLYFAYQRRGCG